MVCTKEISNKLTVLLSKTKETEYGYKIAARRVKDVKLEKFFKEKAEERYVFIYELQSELTTIDGGNLQKQTNTLDWIDMNTLFDSSNEDEIMEQAIFIEKTILQEYNMILKESKIPQTTHLLLEHQKNKIDRGFSPIQSIEEL